jgi:hypothetical protein
MKKILIGAIATTLCFSTLFAQKKEKNNHPAHNQQAGKRLKELNLSATQKEQVKAARQNTEKQLAELKKNDQQTVKDFKASKDAILQSQKDQVSGILTDEQKNQLAQNKPNDRQGDNAGKNIGKMKEKLGLSEQQVTQIKANRDADQAKIKAVKENSQLSNSEKKEQLKVIKKDQENNLAQILSPEQISKMEQSRKNRKFNRSGE